jgi:hypothetical protein
MPAISWTPIRENPPTTTLVAQVGPHRLKVQRVTSRQPRFAAYLGEELIGTAPDREAAQALAERVVNMIMGLSGS